MIRSYVADFETTTEAPSRVWAWGVSEIGNVENFEYGTTIESFFEWLKKSNKKIYFHNLKFDGEFCIFYLLKKMRFCYSPQKLNRTFNCIIDKTNAFYKIEIIFSKQGKHTKKVEIFDSFKKLPFTVEKIGEGFGLGFEKVKVADDFYSRYRPEDHELTEEEIHYLKLDCQTVAAALGIQFEQGLDKMTIGADALANYKLMLGGGDKKRGAKLFEYKFPVLPLVVDAMIRQAYKGGYVYVNPKKAGKDIKKGKVFDVNSLYPWTLRYCFLPYGQPLPFKGKYLDNPDYPLYIQRLKCSFKLKERHLPTMQLKNNGRFVETEYLTSSMDAMGNDIVDITLTNVDLQLLFDHYIVEDIEYIGGFMFKGAFGMFDEYVEYWMAKKIEAEKTGNKALRNLSKLMLNNLYGKFSKNPDVTGRYPYINDKGVVAYKNLRGKDTFVDDKGKEHKVTLDDPVYTAMGAFVTAYAREKTIRSCQENYDRFIYADTDSCHIEGGEMPTNIEIDPYALGAWKHESDFTRGRFLRAKTYIEEIDGELHVTAAGMPNNVKKLVTWDNFHVGLELGGKLMPKHVEGGIILQPTTFKIA